MKTVLLIAFIGHVLCGICDCLLSYSPNGRLDLKGALKSPEKYAITAFGFGYLALSRWMEQYSDTASAVMYISAVVFLISIVVHHIICGLVEWLYVRLGRTDEAREAALEFQKKTIATMVVGYLGLAAFVFTLFIMVITGKTSLPQWACVLNTLPLMIILLPTKLPAKGNIAGALMFLGLFIII